MTNYCNLTGSRYAYDYIELPAQVTADQVAAYCHETRRRFAPIAKSLTDSDNSRWLLRHYLALKFVISASTLIGSSEYSWQRNVLMSVPYLNYYALLNVCRAFLLTAPDGVPMGRESENLTHERILNTTANLMRRLDPDAERRWGDELRRARDHRNLFSYQFPASGLAILKDTGQTPHQVGNLARLIAELAMLNSECLQSALARHAPQIVSTPRLRELDWVTVYDIAGQTTKDSVDREWLSKHLARGHVTTLAAMVWDGLIEDFYGAWVPAYEEGDNPDPFNPDLYMYHLLRV
jgi:hypothetical protein